MIFANPMPSDKALQAAYNLKGKEYNDFFKADYLDTPKVLNGSAEWQFQVSDRCLATIEKSSKNKGRILDIGCGSGVFLEAAQKRGWQTTGIDPGDWCANLERDRQLNIIRCPLFNAKLEKESFDVIYMGSVLEHLQDPQAYVSAIHTLLKPGGMVFITGLPNVNSFTIRLGIDRWIGNHPPIHLLYFSRKTVGLLLKKHGFKHIKVKSFGIPETILEMIFNRKGEKYSGSYAEYVHKPSLKGKLTRITRSAVYKILDLTGVGSVLELHAKKSL